MSWYLPSTRKSRWWYESAVACAGCGCLRWSFRYFIFFIFFYAVIFIFFLFNNSTVTYDRDAGRRCSFTDVTVRRMFRVAAVAGRIFLSVCPADGRIWVTVAASTSAAAIFTAPGRSSGATVWRRRTARLHQTFTYDQMRWKIIQTIKLWMMWLNIYHRYCIVNRLFFVWASGPGTSSSFHQNH